MRVFASLVFCAIAMAAKGQAQEATDSAGALPAGAAATSGWVRDSTPPRKGYRQTFWAVIAAKDTVAGKYRATRPILQLYCHNNVKKVRLQIFTGQLVAGRYPNPVSGSRVGRTEVLLQHDDRAEQKAVWLFNIDSHVIGPDDNDHGKTVDETAGTTRYRVGAPFDGVGRRYMEFDVTGIAEQMEWVGSHCGVKSK